MMTIDYDGLCRQDDKDNDDHDGLGQNDEDDDDQNGSGQDYQDGEDDGCDRSGSDKR